MDDLLFIKSGLLKALGGIRSAVQAALPKTIRRAVWLPVIACVFAVFSIGHASAVPINIFNTGVDASGAVVPGGTVGDAHYSIIQSPFPNLPAIKAATASEGYPVGPWLPDNTLSRWIGPDTFQLGGPAGTYIYRTTFDLTGFDPTTASLSGLWSVDNLGIDILINGFSTGHTLGNPLEYRTFTPFLITNGFIAGMNTLDFLVTNLPGTGTNPTGLRVEISGTVNAVPIPAALPLYGTGLAVMGFIGWRRKRKAKT